MLPETPQDTGATTVDDSSADNSPTTTATTSHDPEESTEKETTTDSHRRRYGRFVEFFADADRRWLLLIFIGYLLRAGLILIWRGPMDHVFSDPSRHLDNARHFLEPGPMGCSNPYFYQLFLWVIISVTKEARIWMHLIAVALSWLHPYVWYRFASTVMVKRKNALRLWAILTFLPTHATMFTFLMNETLMLPLLGGALWATSVAAQRRSSWRFLLATLLWTCTFLTRSIALPIAGVAMLYALVHQPGRPLWKRPLLASASAAIAAVGLWVAAQHSVRILEYATPFGDNANTSIYMISGAKGYQVTYIKPKKYRYTYVFSSPSYYVSPFDPFYQWTSVRQGTFKYTTNVETHGKDLEQVWRDQFKKNKHRLPRLVFENIILTFGHSWPEAGKGALWPQVCLQERWIWLPVTLTAVLWSLAFMIRRRRLFPVPVLVLFATGLLYGLQLVVMEGRYRKPIEPILFLGILWLVDALSDPKIEAPAKQ